MRFNIMKNAWLWLCFGIFLLAVTVKTEFYSDITDDEYRKLQEIASYLRKRVEEIDPPKGLPLSDATSDSDSAKGNVMPPFDYTMVDPNPGSDDASVFAVGPSDPRYYQGFASPFAAGNRPKATMEEVNKFDMTSERVNSDEDYASTGSEVRQVPVTGVLEEENKADIYFTAIVAGCSAAAVVSIIVIGISCYRLHKNAKAAANVDYPAYGVTGPNKDISPSSGDRRLAQSAQMYHYQHQKQQILAMESMCNKDRRGSISDAESEDDNEEGDYTVYECPGLAPTGEMEVKNPLFRDDSVSGPNPKTNPIEPKEESQEHPK